MVSVAGPVAFVLPGGATWGAVQVGMLAALTDAGIVPDLLVGTSVGALNAAMFAAAPDARGVAALGAAWGAARRPEIFPLNPLHLARAVARRQGHLLDNAGLRRWIERHLAFARLEDSPVPVHVMATDVDATAPVMLSAGDAITALLASCAIPGIFPPVTIDGRRLADGGSTANEPVPQALALGAATVFQLSTYGPRQAPVAPRRARVVEVLDRRFGRPPVPQTGGAPVPQGVVHVLPAPPTADLNPFSFRQTGRLIDRSAELVSAWLAEGLDGRRPPSPVPAPAPFPHIATGS
jgi:NTE family protein